MKIAIEGCAHGELEKIYDSILNIEERDNIKVDLLICCGDFQSTRNYEDLQCMAVPQKYLDMCTFYKYYSGELVAPILTIFIGGNHEASNYLQELAFGGWVAPNIYYLGYAGIVNVGGIRIAGISGIYKGHDYMRGHFELPPYGNDTKRSVYHVRNIEVFRLKQTKQPIDIFVSHDWPRGIYNHGNANQLLKCKPFFAEEVRTNTLGSKACEELLDFLKPAYWFAAHLHVKFAALVSHESETEGESKVTKFLALDKCLPRRQFLQILDIPHDETKPLELQYDLEWLTIIFLTNHLTSVKRNIVYLPNQGDNCRWDFSPTAEETDLIRRKFHDDFRVPLNFAPTVTPYDPDMGRKRRGGCQQPTACINPQTMTFCDLLGIDDPMAMALGRSDTSLNNSNLNQTLPSFLTPERPGELTRVSLMSESSFLDEPEPPTVKRLSLVLPLPRNLDTSDSDDVRSDELEPLSRVSLSLPLPVNITSEDEVMVPRSRLSLSPLGKVTPENEGEKSTQGLEEDSCLLSPITRMEDSLEKDKAEVQDDASAIIPCTKIQTDVEGTVAEIIEEPKVKKFKRRNQALYTNMDDD